MSLYQYYKLGFDVSQYHRFTLTEYENMMPYERELYVRMLADKVKKESQDEFI